MGSLLAVFSSTTILLVDSSPKTSFGGSLKPLSLCRAFLLLLPFRRCRITSNFLVNKLHAEGDLPSHAEQVTQTFQVFVNLLPIDLQLLASFRQAASTAFLGRHFDNRFFARIFVFWEFVLVLEIVIKSGVELNLLKITRSQDKISICV